MYTLGHLRAKGGRKVFPIESDNGNPTETGEQKQDLMYADCGVGHKWTERNSIAPPLRSQGSGNAPGIAVKQLGNVMPTATRDNPNQGRVYDPAGIAPCLNKMEGGGREPLITELCACLTPDRLEKGQNGRRFKDTGEPMFTLTKQDIHGVLFTQKKITRETDIAGTLTARNPSTSRGNYTPITGIVMSHDGVSAADTAFTLKAGKHGPAGVDGNHPQNGVQHGTRIRRLTPRECMRLQGVPDYITGKLIAAGISDTQMYRAAGDACTVNVIYEIARRL